MPKYGNSTPGSQKWNFSKKFIFLKRSPDFASNEPSTTPDIKFKSSYARKLDFSFFMPKYGNSTPGSQKWNFSKKIHFFEKVSRFRFQRALNHPQTLSLSQVMQENVIMPKYGNSAPGSQKWNFSKKFIF